MIEGFDKLLPKQKLRVQNAVCNQSKLLKVELIHRKAKEAKHSHGDIAIFFEKNGKQYRTVIAHQGNGKEIV